MLRRSCEQASCLQVLCLSHFLRGGLSCGALLPLLLLASSSQRGVPSMPTGREEGRGGAFFVPPSLFCDLILLLSSFRVLLTYLSPFSNVFLLRPHRPPPSLSCLVSFLFGGVISPHCPSGLANKKLSAKEEKKKPPNGAQSGGADGRKEGRREKSKPDPLSLSLLLHSSEAANLFLPPFAGSLEYFWQASSPAGILRISSHFSTFSFRDGDGSTLFFFSPPSLSSRSIRARSEQRESIKGRRRSREGCDVAHSHLPAPFPSFLFLLLTKRLLDVFSEEGRKKIVCCKRQQAPLFFSLSSSGLAASLSPKRISLFSVRRS